MARSVILITIDCLRVDHVAFMGYERPTTPNLDRLAQEAVSFNNAFATGPRTAESFPGILASTYALMYGGGYALTDRHTSVAEVLRHTGCATAAFHSSPYLSTNYGYDRGFSVFWDSLDKVSRVSKLGLRLGSRHEKNALWYRVLRWLGAMWHAGRRAVPFVRAEVVNEKAINWLGTPRSRFFLWVHYMDPHYPYLPAEKHLRLFRRRCPSGYRLQRLMVKMAEAHDSLTEEERRLLIDLYDAEVRYTDACIGHLLNWLRSNGLYDEPVIIVTADHGEEFGEHGGFGHATWASEVRDGRVAVKLHDELLHVPLLIRFPQGRYAGAQVDELVSLLDLSPTIVDCMGADPPESWQGHSLLPLVSDEQGGRPFVFAEYKVHNRGFEGPVIACRTKRWKYIHEGVFGRHELYSLRDDPSEANNLVASQPDEAEKLRFNVAQHLHMLHETAAAPKEVDLDEHVIERLRALGYLE